MITTAWTGTEYTGADIEYSLNGGAWTRFVIGRASGNTSVSVPEDGYMELKGTTGVSLSTTRYSVFIFTGAGTVEASGNITSLVGDNDSNAMMCYRLFRNCTKLTSAPELDCKTVLSNSYNAMFEGCTALTGMPWIQATDWANGAFTAMFKNCAQLSSIRWDITEADFRAANNTSTFRDIVTGTVNGGKFYFTEATAAGLRTTWTTLWNGWTVEEYDINAERAGLLLTFGNLVHYHDIAIRPLITGQGAAETALLNLQTLTGNYNAAISALQNANTHHTDFSIYANVQAFVTAANNGCSWKVGDVIIIGDRGVPDMWVTGTPFSPQTYSYSTDEAFVSSLEAGDMQVGYITVTPVEAAFGDIEGRVVALETLGASYESEVRDRLGQVTVCNGQKTHMVGSPYEAQTVNRSLAVMLDTEEPSFTDDYIDSVHGTRDNIVRLNGRCGPVGQSSTTAPSSQLSSQRYKVMRFYLSNVSISSAADVTTQLTTAGYTLLGTDFSVPIGMTRCLVLSEVEDCTTSTCTIRKYAQMTI